MRERGGRERERREREREERERERREREREKRERRGGRGREGEGEGEKGRERERRGGRGREGEGEGEKERRGGGRGDQNLNHLSFLQLVRSAIHASWYLTSPIGFLFLKLLPPPCPVLLVSTLFARLWGCIGNMGQDFTSKNEDWTNRVLLHGFTMARFRNLMSTAAGQKFLNENLHRTSVLSSRTQFCVWARHFFKKTIISWIEDRWLLCFEWTFGSIWWLHVVHVVEQSCACRGRIFRWCHHAAFGTRWFRSIQKGSVTVAAGFASEMLVEICLRCLHRVKFLWKKPKDPEIQIQWPNHRSSKQSLKLVVGSSTGSY